MGRDVGEYFINPFGIDKILYIPKNTYFQIFSTYNCVPDIDVKLCPAVLSQTALCLLVPGIEGYLAVIKIASSPQNESGSAIKKGKD